MVFTRVVFTSLSSKKEVPRPMLSPNSRYLQIIQMETLTVLNLLGVPYLAPLQCRLQKDYFSKFCPREMDDAVVGVRRKEIPKRYNHPRKLSRREGFFHPPSYRLTQMGGFRPIRHLHFRISNSRLWILKIL
jgi:hypothetical protein